jgi:ribosomal protein L40E
MATPTTPSATAPPPAALTHPCARCGAPVPLDVGQCERCNPLGLRDSASSQVHGTVFVAVGLAIAGLAIAAHLAVAGIGPFEAQVAELRAQEGGLTVSLRVTNEGTSTGATTCRITDPASNGAGKSAFVLSPRIAPGATITFDHRLTDFGTGIRPLAVECSAP